MARHLRYFYLNFHCHCLLYIKLKLHKLKKKSFYKQHGAFHGDYAPNVEKTHILQDNIELKP